MQKTLPIFKTLTVSIIAFYSLIVGATSSTLDTDGLHKKATVFFKPLPQKMPGSERDTAAQIELGKQLYFETALSINGTQSCNSCHRVDEQLGGVDNEKTSPGALGKRGDRNSPTVWNAGFHIAQFWDGRAADLKEQAKGPILNPIEMGLPDEATAINKLRKAGYESKFSAAFPNEKEALTYENTAHAIAAFERTLITKDRFDQFLLGDKQALSTAEQQGLSAFLDAGCAACHSGALLGGQMYQKMGLVNAYPNTLDTGRYALTKNSSDKFVFKVPSLRNISQTAPYFHDGGAETLKQAVKDMSWYQLGRKLDDEQAQSIVTFLNALENQH